MLPTPSLAPAPQEVKANPLGPSPSGPLGPQVAEQTPGEPSGSASDLMGGLESQTSVMQAHYDKLMKAKETLDKVREQMDGLAALGDTVQHEDVVKSAGELVGSGLSAAAVASILADMPALPGEALSMWVAEQDAQVRQREVQLMQVTDQVRHQMGVAAVQHLMGHAVQALRAQSQGPSAISAPEPNPLMPNAAPDAGEPNA